MESLDTDAKPKLERDCVHLVHERGMRVCRRRCSYVNAARRTCPSTHWYTQRSCCWHSRHQFHCDFRANGADPCFDWFSVHVQFTSNSSAVLACQRLVCVFVCCLSVFSSSVVCLVFCLVYCVLKTHLAWISFTKQKIEPDKNAIKTKNSVLSLSLFFFELIIIIKWTFCGCKCSCHTRWINNSYLSRIVFFLQQEQQETPSIIMSAVDEIIGYKRSPNEEFYALLNCDEHSSVSVGVQLATECIF